MWCRRPSPCPRPLPDPFPAPPRQRPYDIHASNSVESLIQLFSTISVQYSPAWPKDLVSLLRKVRQTLGPAVSPPHPGVFQIRLLRSCRLVNAAVSVFGAWARVRVLSVLDGGWAASARLLIDYCVWTQA